MRTSDTDRAKTFGSFASDRHAAPIERAVTSRRATHARGTRAREASSPADSEAVASARCTAPGTVLPPLLPPRRHGEPRNDAFSWRPVSNPLLERLTRPAPLTVSVPDRRRSNGGSPPDVSNGSGVNEGLYRVRRRNQNAGPFASPACRVESAGTCRSHAREVVFSSTPPARTPRTRADRPRSDYPSLPRRPIAVPRTGTPRPPPFAACTPTATPRRPLTDRRRGSRPRRTCPRPSRRSRRSGSRPLSAGGAPRWTASPPACGEAAWGATAASPA